MNCSLLGTSFLAAVVISLSHPTLCSAASVAPWPQFRGPASRGIAEQANPPIRFGPETNVLWKIDVPRGHSSPIVLRDRIAFDATEGKTLLTCAVDRKTGSTLWRQGIPVDNLEKLHAVNSATPCTPVTDGERIYSYLPSFGLVAYDLDGKEQWRKPLPLPQTFMGQGSGASPLLTGGLLIVELPQESAREVIAVHAQDGTEAWKATQPLRQMGWATPIAWNDANGDCVGVTFGGQFCAYRLSDGKELWSVGSIGAEACATPVVEKDCLIISSAGIQGEPANVTIPPPFADAAKRWDANHNGIIERDEIPNDYLLTDRKAGGKGNMTLKQMMRWFQDEESKRGFNKESWEKLREGLTEFRNGEFNRANLVRVRLGGQGDVTKTHTQWQETRAVPEIPSPLVYRDRIYLVRNGGLLACRNLQDGKLIFDGRLEAAGGYFASPVAAAGRIYLASDRGEMTVVEAADELRVLARNSLGEPIFASPAAVGDVLYVRSSAHLWAFGR